MIKDTLLPACSIFGRAVSLCAFDCSSIFRSACVDDGRTATSPVSRPSVGERPLTVHSSHLPLVTHQRHRSAARCPAADNIDAVVSSSREWLVASRTRLGRACKFVFPLGRRLFDHAAAPRPGRSCRGRSLPATAYRRPADSRYSGGGPGLVGHGIMRRFLHLL